MVKVVGNEVKHASVARRGGQSTLAAVVVLLLAAPTGAYVQYNDATEEAGIDFQMAGEIHGELTDGWPAFPEIMGGGACWGDLDGDGYDDLYLVNQRFNPENPFVQDWYHLVDPLNALYLNDGRGGFMDATIGSGLESPSWGYGCSLADYDGDRDLDVYVSGFGVSELYRNDGDAVFTDVTEAAGLVTDGLCFDYECMGTSTAWADYDLDGDLDLYVGNYVETTLDDLGRGPISHVAQMNFLFRNEGDGTFVDVAQDVGVAGNPSDEHGSKSLGVVWFDHDLDGDPDLYVANDEVPNDFYVNNGDGTFTEDDDAGLANSLAGMGVTSGDYDADGYPDLFFTHYHREENGFYRNLGDGTFEDRSGEDDLTTARDAVGWGTAFVDVDRDGDLDIVAANGHTEWNLEYGQKTMIWSNEGATGPGDHEWVDITDDSGAGLEILEATRGAAFADYDVDGDTDVVLVNQGNATATLLRASNLENNWLRISLFQPGSNAFGVGARITLDVGGEQQYREIQTGTSYLSQNELAASFGLGSATQADSITVQWPGGGTTVVTDVAGNRAIGIDRALGVVEDIFAPVTELLADGHAPGQMWFTEPVDISLQAVDLGTGATGVASTMFAAEDGALEPYTGQTVRLETEGLRTLRYHSYDNAGNREPVRSAVVGIDTVPPTASATVSGSQGDNGWFVGDATVRVAGADDLSGVAARSYRIDGGDWKPYRNSVTISDDGEHLFEYKARDRAGNESPIGSTMVRIDTGRPSLLLNQPDAGRIYVANQMLPTPAQFYAVIVSDRQFFPVGVHAVDGGSGIDRVEFSLDGVRRAVDTEAPFTWSWPLADEKAGTHEVFAVAYDKAGNFRADKTSVLLVNTDPGGAKVGQMRI